MFFRLSAWEILRGVAAKALNWPMVEVCRTRSQFFGLWALLDRDPCLSDSQNALVIAAVKPLAVAPGSAFSRSVTVFFTAAKI